MNPLQKCDRHKCDSLTSVRSHFSLYIYIHTKVSLLPYHTLTKERPYDINICNNVCSVSLLPNKILTKEQPYIHI